MDPKFQTSFIPKKVSSGPLPGYAPRVTMGPGVEVVRDANIFSVVATVIFIATFFTFGGLYGYKYLLTRQIVQANQDIEAAREAFEVDKIQNLLDANSRMSSAATLLDKHVAVSRTLFLLQDLIVKKMRFTSLQYTSSAGNNVLALTGQAQSYNALAQEKVIIEGSTLVQNPSFSSVSLSDNGLVSFKFDAQLVPDLLSYKKTLSQASVPTTETVATTTNSL